MNGSQAEKGHHPQLFKTQLSVKPFDLYSLFRSFDGHSIFLFIKEFMDDKY